MTHLFSCSASLPICAAQPASDTTQGTRGMLHCSQHPAVDWTQNPVPQRRHTRASHCCAPVLQQHPVAMKALVVLLLGSAAPICNRAGALSEISEGAQ